MTSKQTYTFVKSTLNEDSSGSGGGGGGETGETITASNLGSGKGVFSSKVASDLQFKSLTAGSNVTLTENTLNVEIATNPSLQLADGMISAPSLCFINNPDQGLFRNDAENQMLFVADGDALMTIDDTEIVTSVVTKVPTLRLITAVNSSTVGDLAILGCYGFEYGTPGNTIVSCNGNLDPTVVVDMEYLSVFDGRTDVIKKTDRDGYISFTDISQIQNLTEFTVSFWLYCDINSGTSFTRSQFRMFNTAETSYLEVVRIGSTLTQRFRGQLLGVSQFDLQVGSVFGVSAWKNFVVTVGPNGAKLWVDGVLGASSASTFSPNDFTVDEMRLGTPSSASTGYIDNIIFSSTEASQADVDIIYREAFSITGGIVVTELTQLEGTKLSDIPSGNDLISWTATSVDVEQPLTYTGDIPIDSGILKSDATGLLSYELFNFETPTLTEDSLTITTANDTYDEMLSYVYTPKASTSTLFIEVQFSYRAATTLNTVERIFTSLLDIDDTTTVATLEQRAYGHSYTGTLFVSGGLCPLSGTYANTTATAKTIKLKCKVDLTADHTFAIVSGSGRLKITEY